MATELWSKFLDDVLPDAPGCYIVVAEHAIRNAAIEFCRRAWVWEYRGHAPISLVANQPEYTLTPPDGTEVAMVLKASISGQPIDPVSPDTLDVAQPDWEGLIGTVSSYHMAGRNTLRLVRIPSESAAAALTVKLALMPKQTATGMDADVYATHREDIAHGALYRLMAMRNKPWSDAQGALFHKGLFDEAVNSAAISRAKGGVRSPLRVATCP